MRVVVTGASGFVGRPLTTLLEASGHEVVRCSRAQIQGTEPLDLAGIYAVVHLAGQAFVPEAIASPIETYEVNVLGTARIARALARHTAASGERPRLIFASSGEVYGNVPADMLPISEATAPNPYNPYAASKAAAEAILLGEHRSFGLDVVIGRAFNAIGPGQNTRFAIADFAAQLVKIGKGAPARISVGDLSVQRDFLDVRDVASAYLALIERGAPGGIYNICSGTPRSIESLLGELIDISGVELAITTDHRRLRTTDLRVVVGSNAKLRTETDWTPTRSLTTSLRDALQWIRDNEDRAHPS